jgi:hypothetical protein
MEIRTEPDGTLGLLLPPRPQDRTDGVIAILLGLLGLGVAAVAAVFLIGFFAPTPWVFQLFALPLALAGLVMALRATLLAMGGAAMLAGRSRAEVWIGARRIRFLERAWGLPIWSTAIRRQAVAGVEIRTMPGGDTPMLLIARHRGETKRVLPGYPEAVLQPIADRLRPPPVLELADGPPPAEEPPGDRPWPLLVFALLWTGFSLVMQILAIRDGEWAGAGFLVLFVAAGVAMLLGSIHMIRVRTTLGWEGDRLCWRIRSPLRNRERMWTREQIAGITAREQPGSGRFAAIVVQRTDGGRDELAWGGDVDGAVRAARRLAERAGVPSEPAVDAGVPVPVEAEADAAVPAAVVAGTGWCLRPRGSVLWLVLGCAFMGFGSIPLAIAWSGGDVFPVLFGILFMAVGCGLAVAGVTARGTRWAFRPDPQRWTVTRTGPWSQASWSIDPATVRQVDLEPTGTTVGNERYMRLRITLADGEPLRLAPACDPEALRAIGARLLAARDVAGQ